MKADLSRNTFDRSRHYSAVRLQQGRVVTDADWNEQADISRYRAELAARDTIGPCGAPLDAAGYGLVAETNALAVQALNANVAWILAEDGVLLATTDRGANWTLVDTATSANLRAIAVAGNTGWLVGDGGTVRITRDSGLTWSARNPGTVQSLRGVATVNGNDAWAVGDGGIVASTSDGGLTWSLSQTPVACLYAVGFATASTGFAAGLGGAIVKTADGGQTWSAGASGSTAHLRALAHIGVTHWWAAGSGGTILRSDDGGATWFPGATPSDATLHAIAFRDELEGWAAGANGMLLHSTDGGATWRQESAGTGAETLRGLSIFGAEPGWAVGDGGVALRVGVGSPDVGDVLLPPTGLSIESGRYYVNGMLCELEARCSYAHQPDGGAGERLAPGAYLLYLKAWRRHVSALEAPSIREVALGGPDTATRARTIAQVRALPLLAASPFEWRCGSDLAEWDALVGQPKPRLAARAEPQLAAASLCEIAATAGYRRLENQLYRVEVHEGGVSPTFKWSRENGSVAYAVLSVSVDTAAQQTTVRVAMRGRDANLDLAVHDRVELIDDDAELTQRAGMMLEYVADGEDALELVLAGVPPAGLGQDPAKHPLLRRWDHQPAAADANTLPVAFDTWIDLEDGVQVRFDAGGTWRPGDYWQIPARTITADVEWPRDENGDPVPCEPAGVADACCRLGIVEVDAHGTVRVSSDCRAFFPPLVQMETLLYVCGDGQDAAPATLLPQPLALRVARGSVPVAGAGVRFEVETGGGWIGPGPGGSPWQYETTTDAEGLAACRWTLGPAAGATARFQRVRASLLDGGGQPIPGQVLLYCATATLSLEYVGGDGQQAPPSGVLANPLAMHVRSGSDGVAGITLKAAVERGGGAVVGASTVTTDAQGYAMVGWQLGSGGAQQLSVRLEDADGRELQRLSYGATVAQGGRGGCAVTIGPGGQFERLDSDLLTRLLDAGKGAVSLCFMPGTHQIDNLVLAGRDRTTRLSIHGCGAATTVSISGRILLNTLSALEISDLALIPSDSSMLLQSIEDLRLTGLSITRPATQSASPLLAVSDVNRLRVSGCQIGLAARASAVIEKVATECHLGNNVFLGPLSFYGAPGDDPSRALEQRYGDGQRVQFAPQGRLYLADNSFAQLTIGATLAALLLQGNADGVFQGASIQGNTFGMPGNVFVSQLLSFSGNSFLTQPQNGATYGVLLASRSTATGNVAQVLSDQAVLHFLVPGDGGFSGAANQVFTLPRST